MKVFPKKTVTVSVLGGEEGYTVKCTPLPERVPKGTPEGNGVYLTIYPESVWNQYSDIWIYLNMYWQIYSFVQRFVLF